jgi:hypothetical protein
MAERAAAEGNHFRRNKIDRWAARDRQATATGKEEEDITTLVIGTYRSPREIVLHGSNRCGEVRVLQLYS